MEDNIGQTDGTATGGDYEGGGRSGGGGVGTLVASETAPTRKRRGRPPSPSRVHGSGALFPNGGIAATQNYLRATGSGDSSSSFADRDTGERTYETEGNGTGSAQAARVSREASRGSQPELVPLPGTGAKRGRPRKVDASNVREETVAHAVCAIYGVISVLTKHKHWQKTTDRVKPITEPLTEWINSMEPQTVEKLQSLLLPASVITGIVTVSTPDILIEMEFRKQLKMAMAGAPMMPPPAPVGGAIVAAPQGTGTQVVTQPAESVGPVAITTVQEDI